MKKQFITYLLICSMVVSYGFLTPLVKIVSAASFSNVSATLSTSEPGVSATTTIQFTTSQTIDSNGTIEITFPAEFTMTTNNGDVDCGTTTLTGTISGQVVTCTNSSGGDYTAATTTITVGQNTNPATTDSYTLEIESKSSGGTTLETGQAMVAIIDTVQVSATVEATLEFTIAPVATSTVVNGADATTGSSTATTMSFGTLTVGTPSVMAQELTVVTNATEGYTVTVEQDQNLTNAGGSDIDSFADGNPSIGAWTSPSGTLDSEETYGHFGITSEDATLSSGDTFGSALFNGFTAQTPLEVMYHDGPADGSTHDKGLTRVAYAIEISSLQEAGDYSNTLTYICTPTY